MSNDLEELRAHLFGAMRMVKSREMKPDEARVISDLGRTLIGTAKIELQYMHQIDQRCDTGFLKIDKRPAIGQGKVAQIGSKK